MTDAGDGSDRRERTFGELESVDVVVDPEERHRIENDQDGPSPVDEQRTDRIRAWLASNTVPVAVAAGVLALGVLGAMAFVAARSRRRPRGAAAIAHAARRTLAAAADRITTARAAIRRRR